VSVKVLVVDDSAFARKVLREILTAAGFDVVGIARDGLDALEKINELRPDVVTLDLIMPHLDGVGVLKALPLVHRPRVVLVSMVDEDSELGLSALRLGAVDIVHKPTALAVEGLYDLGAELVAKVRAAASARVPASLVAEPRPAVLAKSASDRVVVIGTSTGGPQALTRIARAIPAGFPAPIAMALHIPPGYTEALAQRLDSDSAIEVLEARDGLEMKVGRAILARSGYHMKIVGPPEAATVSLDLRPVEALYRPSIDVLFESAAAVWGSRLIAVVLTGMGDDGTRGARAVRAAGGTVLTESEASCVVYGMPRAVVDAGLSDASAPLDGIVDLVAARL
jgi:two-component system chemotaxis response regulator CheB